MTKISAFRMKNYKAFRDTGWIMLKPITMLLGYNSNGKSTILKALYFIKQCYEKYQAGLDYNPFSTGNDADGGFADYFYKGKTNGAKSIEFSFRIVCNEAEFLDGLKLITDEPITSECVIEYAVSARQNRKKKDVYIDSFRIYFAEKNLYSCEMKENGDFKVTSDYFGKIPKGNCELPLFYNIRDTFFLANLTDLRYPDWISKDDYSDRIGPQQRFIIPFFQHDVISLINRTLTDFSASLAYIMPVRELPSRYMNLIASKTKDVGINGNNTYNILYQLEMFADEKSREKVQKWLNLFGYSYRWRVIRPNYGELLLHDNKRGYDINILDVGFGISQILPIIVAACQDEKGLFAVDSPEAHLHVSIQSEIADLFIETAQRRPIIIETHSENILLRVQRRVAEGSLKAGDVGIYFVDEDKDEVTCRRLIIDDSGRIPDSGEDFQQFFSSAYNDAFETLLASRG